MNSAVVGVYDRIATSFNKTRFSHWSGVADFILKLPPNSKLGDIGCGNGKYFDVRTDIEIMACDASSKQVDICWDRVHDRGYKHVEVYQADVRKIPILTDYLDAVICVAVLHHLPVYKDRIAAVLELYRIIRPGGCVLFTMWAEVDMDVRKETKKWVPQGHGDYLIPWTLSENGERSVLYRYYHLLNELEAKQMCADIVETIEANGMKVHIDLGIDQYNWNITMSKPR
jgi:ubiquinone/menaquinone biosynthesis C-methylase UbiE